MLRFAIKIDEVRVVWIKAKFHIQILNKPSLDMLLVLHDYFQLSIPAR